MAKSKVTKGNKTKTAKSEKPAPKKIPFYAQPARLFTAAKNGALPRGIYARSDNMSLDEITVKVGNSKLCVFEGKLVDLLAVALKAQGIKLDNGGAIIPSPASATPSA